jgi:hypothetical protein
MALEAVNANRCVFVTGGTEIFGTFGSHNFTVVCRLGMAVNATGQAIFFRANAIENRVVTLMQQKLHVIAAHDIGWLDALQRILWCNYVGQDYISKA